MKACVSPGRTLAAVGPLQLLPVATLPFMFKMSNSQYLGCQWLWGSGDLSLRLCVFSLENTEGVSFFFFFK